METAYALITFARCIHFGWRHGASPLEALTLAGLGSMCLLKAGNRASIMFFGQFASMARRIATRGEG